jgi:hypothetical protein
MAGIGVQPAGVSPAGLGTPNEAADRGGRLFRDAKTGKSLSGRYIDPRTRRYVLDANGRTMGMTAAQQGVHFAVATDLGKSAVREIGNRLKSVKTIGVNYQRQIESVITDALSRLIQSGLVKLESVESKRVGQSGAYLHIRWRDLSTGELRTTDVRN